MYFRPPGNPLGAAGACSVGVWVEGIDAQTRGLPWNHDPWPCDASEWSVLDDCPTSHYAFFEQEDFYFSTNPGACCNNWSCMHFCCSSTIFLWSHKTRNNITKHIKIIKTQHKKLYNLNILRYMDVSIVQITLYG